MTHDTESGRCDPCLAALHADCVRAGSGVFPDPAGGFAIKCCCVASQPDRHAESVALEGVALTIWQEVVYRGEHLVLHRDTRPVAVVVPIDDYEAMRRQIDGTRCIAGDFPHAHRDGPEGCLYPEHNDGSQRDS